MNYNLKQMWISKKRNLRITHATAIQEELLLLTFGVRSFTHEKVYYFLIQQYILSIFCILSFILRHE